MLTSFCRCAVCHSLLPFPQSPVRWSRNVERFNALEWCDLGRKSESRYHLNFTGILSGYFSRILWDSAWRFSATREGKTWQTWFRICTYPAQTLIQLASIVPIGYSSLNDATLAIFKVTNQGASLQIEFMNTNVSNAQSKSSCRLLAVLTLSTTLDQSSRHPDCEDNRNYNEPSSQRLDFDDIIREKQDWGGCIYVHNVERNKNH